MSQIKLGQTDFKGICVPLDVQTSPSWSYLLMYTASQMTVPSLVKLLGNELEFVSKVAIGNARLLVGVLCFSVGSAC